MVDVSTPTSFGSKSAFTSALRRRPFDRRRYVSHVAMDVSRLQNIHHVALGHRTLVSISGRARLAELLLALAMHD